MEAQTITAAPKIAASSDAERSIIQITLSMGKRHGRDSDQTADVSAVWHLDRDVTNPKPDRRSKDFPCLPSWPAGTRFRVVVRTWAATLDPEDRHVERAGMTELIGIYPLDERHASIYWYDLGQPKRAAIMSRLLPTDETVLDALCRVAGMSSNRGESRDECDLLAWAVEAGELGQAHAEKIIDAFINREED